MADEFETHSDNNFSAFWPLLLLVCGLLVWAAYQDYAANSQRRLYDNQFQAAVPTIQEAQNVSQHYVALMKDLLQTAQKDPAAADIVKAAIAAGLIHVQQNAAAGTNAPAATPPAGESAPAKP